jgi:hypothetical protein
LCDDEEYKATANDKSAESTANDAVEPNSDANIYERVPTGSIK